MKMKRCQRKNDAKNWDDLIEFGTAKIEEMKKALKDWEDAKTAGRPFRLVARRLTVTVLTLGLAAAPVLTLGRTIRLQSQWADPSRRQRLLLITDMASRNLASWPRK